jgi:carbon starvation protein
MCAVTFSAAYLKIFSPDPRLGFLSGAEALDKTSRTLSDAVKAAEMTRQAGIWRFDAMVALGFVLLVFLIAAGSAREWWRLLKGSRPIVLHEGEFVPLARVESGGV